MTSISFIDQSRSKIALLICLFIGVLSYSQTTREIFGTVTHLNAPIENVNITVRNTEIGVKSDGEGHYRIIAKTGDVLVYSHLGFQKLSIVIEDVTKVLNVELQSKVNELEETIITARNNKNLFVENIEKRDEEFKTAVGNLNPKALGFSVPYIDGKDISSVYPSIVDALIGKFAGASRDPVTGKFVVRGNGSINNPRGPLWDIDGFIFYQEPTFLNLDNIKDIHILKGLGVTTLYGSLGAGGVVVIRTNSAVDGNSISSNNDISDDYINKNIYKKDALNLKHDVSYSNTYTDFILKLRNLPKSVEYFHKISRDIDNYRTFIEIAATFNNDYGATKLAKNILVEQSEKHAGNPEVLKALAYHLQGIGQKKEAVNVYKQVFNLRPNYAQSYRDLANAYIESGEYSKAWQLYLSYFMQGHDAMDEGISSMMYNEMEYLYFNRKKQSEIKQKFIPRNSDVNGFSSDVRLVVEWNTGEAEFDIEFVNPDSQVYEFNHTLASSNELITKEKIKGYSSKEFFIDEIDEGEWLINMTYKGNKKAEPTFLKLTVYYNWGKPSQKHEIKVYQLQEKRQKFKLLRIGKHQIIASN